MKKLLLITGILIPLFLSAQTGMQKTYFDNGQVEEEGMMEDGKREGEWKEYYESGKLFAVYQYENGMLNGPSVAYHENGALLGKANYVNDMPVGYFVSYNMNGEILETGTFDQQGEKVGVWEYRDYYYEDLMTDNARPVQLKSVKTEKDGELHGVQEEYYRNGQLERREHYSNGERDGLLVRYYENGNLAEKATVIDGEIDGEYIVYHENGKMAELEVYSMGSKEGVWKEFFEDGSLKEKTSYRYDKKHGEYITYSESTGKVSEKGRFANGEKHGVWKEYYWNGFLENKTKYEYGKYISQENYPYQLRLQFENACDKDIQVAIRFKDTEGVWRTKAWYKFESGEDGYVADLHEETEHIFFYAESISDNSTWKGDYNRTVDGKSYPFRKRIVTVGEIAIEKVRLTCN